MFYVSRQVTMYIELEAHLVIRQRTIILFDLQFYYTGSIMHFQMM